MKILYLCADAGIPVLGRKGASVHVRELIGAFARAGHRVTHAALAVEQATYRATGFGALAAQAERWTLTHADAVIVVSRELGEHVKSLGVPARIIHVMPNGVNPEIFYPASGRARHSVRAVAG